MSFTTVTVSHTFQMADGTSASGTVTFVPSARMTNGGTTIVPTEVTATLNSSGAFTVNLAANDDPGTVPADVRWQVTARIAGLDPTTWDVVVPHTAATVDLGALLPGGRQVG